jgi:N-acetylglucosamine-6-phosphate deacetylase
MLVIRHPTIFTPDQVIEDGAVSIERGHITSVEAAATAGGGDQEIDGRGLLLIPGLIDMQCNGLAGQDALRGDPQVLRTLAADLARFGCTAVLPTLVTAPHAMLRDGLAAIAEVAYTPGPGARILGAHLEGPWLNPRHHGAHKVDQIRPFDTAEWETLLAAARGTLRLVTLAPEAPGNGQAVATVAASGSLVSLGHSGASYDQALAAADQGARMATHIFNAMVSLHHRQPGLPGAVLDCVALIPGIIPDGHHVHPAIIRLVARARGTEGLVVVTDSVASAGRPPGIYPWRGGTVHWDGETVRLADGTLAGSGLTPIEALRRFMRFTGLPLHKALPAMTTVPAGLLGEAGRLGRIEPGAHADLVLLTPELEVQTTLVNGEIQYLSGEPVPSQPEM